MWWIKDDIPMENEIFQEMVIRFVFECPAMQNKRDFVSMRKNTFRTRGIDHHLLITINNQIKKLFPKNMDHSGVRYQCGQK